VARNLSYQTHGSEDALDNARLLLHAIHMDVRREIERIFGPWLAWSRDEEVLALLAAVVSALRRRGYTVSQEVRPPEPGPR